MSLAADIPLWLVAVLAAAAAVTAYMAYANPPVPLSGTRRAGLTGLRLAALLLLLVLLLRPVYMEPGAAPGTAVAVLLDDSRSMRLADGLPQRRIDRAATLVRDTIVPSLAGRFDVEVVTLDGTPLPAATDAVEPAAPRTDLAAALQTVAERYEGRALAGVVVVSDGGDTGGDGMDEVVGGSLGPVYAVGLGPAADFPDLEVSALTAGEAAVAGSVVDLAAEVVARGGVPAPIPVRLLEGGRLIETRRVAPTAAGTPLRTVFRVAPDADAATLYTVEIPAADGEQVVENNRRSVLVQPPARARRLLLVEGAPGHEHSFLKRVWLADPGLAIDAVVRKGLNERGEQTFYVQGDPSRTAALASGYPRSREALFEYDAVVFANVEPAFFQPAQLEMTAEFVAERGGGLLLLGAITLEGEGFAGSAIEAVIPLALSDRGRPVTAAGRFDNRHRLLLTAG
ncbi:MAG: VWA domain-containing protein, partial [Acidobacteria bacterium]|nr:VWA domain-containing protein [Acidobacteriota bacterium]